MNGRAGAVAHGQRRPPHTAGTRRLRTMQAAALGAAALEMIGRGMNAGGRDAAAGLVRRWREERPRRRHRRSGKAPAHRCVGVAIAEEDGPAKFVIVDSGTAIDARDCGRRAHAARGRRRTDRTGSTGCRSSASLRKVPPDAASRRGARLSLAGVLDASTPVVYASIVVRIASQRRKSTLWRRARPERARPTSGQRGAGPSRRSVRRKDGSRWHRGNRVGPTGPET